MFYPPPLRMIPYLGDIPIVEQVFHDQQILFSRVVGLLISEPYPVYTKDLRNGCRTLKQINKQPSIYVSSQ